MYLKFFNDKKVLVTGHTGFKGSWLCLILLELGAKVIGYSLEPETRPNLFTILGLEKDIKHHIADIRDFETLNKVIQEEEPEIIFHMAAQPLVRRSYREPRLTYETNIMGTVNLFEAVRNSSSIRSVINITTDKVYDNPDQDFAFKESDPLGGYDPYSSSKAGSELITASYRNSFFNPVDYGIKHSVAVASVRAGNVVGGGDWAEDRIIPDCIKSLEQKESISIRNPFATRPWQHVLEPLNGYLKLAYKLNTSPQSFAQAWNFGPMADAAINVEELVKKIISNWGQGSYCVDGGEQAHEAKFLKLDIGKSSEQLGFKPILDIDETITLTVDWYKEFYQNPDAIRKYSLKQINDYYKKRFVGLDDALRRAGSPLLSLLANLSD